MAITLISTMARPDWSVWYVSTPFILSKAGVLETVNLSLRTESKIKDSLNVEVKYYHNGWKTEQHFLGYGGSIELKIGDEIEDAYD